MEEGGKKSFRYDELREAFLVEAKRDLLVHFLEALNQDISVLNELSKKD